MDKLREYVKIIKNNSSTLKEISEDKTIKKIVTYIQNKYKLV
jgi:hypothetical protein